MTATVVGRATVIGTLGDLLSTYIILVYKEIANKGESYTNMCTIICSCLCEREINLCFHIFQQIAKKLMMG